MVVSRKYLRRLFANRPVQLNITEFGLLTWTSQMCEYPSKDFMFPFTDPHMHRLFCTGERIPQEFPSNKDKKKLPIHTQWSSSWELRGPAVCELHQTASGFIPCHYFSHSGASPRSWHLKMLSHANCSQMGTAGRAALLSDNLTTVASAEKKVNQSLSVRNITLSGKLFSGS